MNEPMPPLLFVDRDGEVGRFDSVARAQGYLEWIDVEGGEYRAFDATGRRLRLSFVAPGKRSRWGWLDWRDSGSVTVEGAGDSAPDELRSALIDFRHRYGEARTDLEVLALDALIEGIGPR
jgi:hypothetical protein